MLEWYVYKYDINTKEIKEYNPLNNSGFLFDCKKVLTKYKDDREAFEKEVRSSLMYYYWSKSEYEIILSSWPRHEDVEEKIDIFSQLMLNKDRLMDYLWEHRAEIKKWKPEK